MENAYELKALGEKIAARAKADGLHIAEEAVETLAKAAYLGVKEWAQESAELSETHLDDYVAPFYKYLDQYVMPAIEKIDLDGVE